MTEEMALEAILAHVRARTGLDFREYRRSTVARRIRNRLPAAGVASLADYLALLREHAPETEALLERLTIKVSRFYRNAPAFELVREAVMPALAALRRPVRVWCAGCGQGEEPYTLAMLLEERAIPGLVLATDIDAGALDAAARNRYPEAALRELPHALRERFIEAAGPGFWRVADAVRARVACRIDDLCAAAPAGERFDLVACRNLLIYLERPAQERALARLVDALAPEGWLLLGEAEWPTARAMQALQVVAGRPRLFRATASEAVPA